MKYLLFLILWNFIMLVVIGIIWEITNESYLETMLVWGIGVGLILIIYGTYEVSRHKTLSGFTTILK